MKTTRTKTSLGGMSAIVVLAIAFMVCPAYGDLVLPYHGITSTPEKAFWVSNSYSGSGDSYGGFFYSAGQAGRGVYGQSNGINGFGVKGWAANDGDVINYGGHFCATGMRGVGVYGWAENTGDVENYGGMFLAEGLRGIGIHAKGGPQGLAGEFEGDICIIGDGNGIIFPDGTKQTTAGGGSTADSDWIISGNNMYSGVSGNVGIGTTSPGHKLEIDDTSSGTFNRALVITNTDVTPGNTSVLDFMSDAGGIKSFASIMAQFDRHTSATEEGILKFYTRQGNDFDARMTILATGKVGIGTTSPNYLLHVNGSAGKPGGGSWSNSSDVRLKKNIQDIQGALDKLMQLRGVTFEYKEPEQINELSGLQIGMVAQEVEKVFPQWVDTNADGFKTVTYRGFEALVIEALRQLCEEKDAQVEQQSRIEALEKALEKQKSLEERISAMEARIQLRPITVEVQR